MHVKTQATAFVLNLGNNFPKSLEGSGKFVTI